MQVRAREGGILILYTHVYNYKRRFFFYYYSIKLQFHINAVEEKVFIPSNYNFISML